MRKQADEMESYIYIPLKDSEVKLQGVNMKTKKLGGFQRGSRKD